MNKKSAKIAALIEASRGQSLDPHYLGYFDCFNRGLFYEAHDVLEELWLPQRRGEEGDFYKGLIQFAGAFVLLQKNRLAPAARLFKLARANLQKYPEVHHHLNISTVLTSIDEWVRHLEDNEFTDNPLLNRKVPPFLSLVS